MPSYISHAIMASDLINEINRIDGFKTLINPNELRGYSLGADMAFLSKRLKHDPQNYRTRDFFLSLINYIKDNNLVDNINIMALLYGHMAHYFLDINTHPLIYYLDYGSERVGMFANHDLIEGYLNSYLAKERLGIDIMEVKASYFNGTNFNAKEVSKILNIIYGDIYGDSEIIISYRLVRDLFSFLELFIKSGIVSKDFLTWVSSFNQFLEKNDLTKEEILNSCNGNFRNPVTGLYQKESFIELYHRSIEMCLDAIDEVNKCLYDGYSNDRLLNVFKNLSYDTGVDCSLGKDFIYVRRKRNNNLVLKKTPNSGRN